jgi:hypothetical protein
VPEILCVRVNWDRTARPFPYLRHFYDCHIGPEPGAPFGRKGFVLSNAWRQLASRQAAGMLILDGDVMVDPGDYSAMLRSVHEAPHIVHVAPVKIWPVSTKRESWIWAHWRTEPGMALELAPRWFSFGFTYLPRMLLVQADRAGFRRWAYPGVDMRMSETAQRCGIHARVVTGCWPKHMNY